MILVTDEAGEALLECQERRPELRDELEGWTLVEGNLGERGESPFPTAALRATVKAD